MRKNRALAPFLLTGLVLLGRAGAEIYQGPGLPHLTFKSTELFKPIYTFHAVSAKDASLAKGLNHVAMVNGWLFLPYGEDSGAPGGGIAFWDVSNPRAPTLVYSRDENDMREAHGYGFHQYKGKVYCALQSGHGVMFWDFTDIRSPVKLTDFALSGTDFSDYDHPNWWTMYQAPYVFMGRGLDGFSVLDAHDPAHPVALDITAAGKTRKNFPISSMGGFKIGPTFVIGNLMVVTNMGLEQNPGYATLDVSDPQNPQLLGTDLDHNCYSTFVNGNKIFCTGSGGMEGKLIVHDISDPTNIRKVGESIKLGYKGEYVSTQDEFVHMGAEDRYAKMDITDINNIKVIQNSFELKDGGEEGFCEILGNLVLITDDHKDGSELLPHQTAPDTRGPAINMQSPVKNAVRQHVKSRVGFTFTDQIDLASVNEQTFMVYPLGKPPLAGRYSSQINIVNFTPDQPLEPNTTYEVFVPKGGIKDYSGNPTEKDFSYRFSTGATVDNTVFARPGIRKGPPSLLARPQADGSVLFLARGLGSGTLGGASLTVRNLRGETVKILSPEPGSQDRWRWDRAGAQGNSAVSGVYLATLKGRGVSLCERFYLPTGLSGRPTRRFDGP